MTRPVESTTPATERRAAWLSTVGITVFILVAGYVINLGQEGFEHGGNEGRIACQSFIKDRLKSVEPVEFSDVTQHGFVPMWTVTGDIESLDAGGLPIRSHFRCRVRLDGATWHLVQVDLATV